jgi:hypothetical protein
MESIDITSNTLREKGYLVKKEDNTIALYYDGSCLRSTLYKSDWNKTVKQVEKQFAGKSADIDNLTLQEVLSCMSHNYDKLFNELGIPARIAKQQPSDLIQMEPRAKRANCSMEEWSATLQTKYNHLKTITEQNIPGLWLPLEFVISIKCILNIRNITLPIIGLILGPPSSLKSVAVNMPKGARDTFAVDSFSPKSFVSHNSNLTEEQLQEVDLLPKIKNKLFTVPELSPLFTSKEEDLENIIGMIVRLGDGEGYTSASGAKGTRGYEGPIMFCWLGAAVDIPYKIHKTLSRLGPKMYFLRLPLSVNDEDTLLKVIQQDNFKERVRTVKTALFDYLEYLESCPAMEIEAESGIPKLNWNASDSRQKEAQRYIIYLAELLAYLRGTVTTWETEGTQGLDYAYASRNVENPERAATQLHNLARAHALSQGREYITVEDDLPLIVKVVLSGAASIERVKLLNLLLSGGKDDRYSANDVANAIGTSIKTAKKTMAEFKALGLVDLEELGNVGEPLIQISLKKDDLDWFFEPEFKKLKGDYQPGDFKDQLVKKNKNRNIGTNTIEDFTEDIPKVPPTPTLSF